METRGIHTGEVDALLNAYVSEYINNGALNIRRFPTVGSDFESVDDKAFSQILRKKQDQINEALQQRGFLRRSEEKYSNFAAFMRSSIRKSSAVTPVTNVADVQGLSNDLFNFLSQNESGRQKISIAVSADEASRLLGIPKLKSEITAPFENVDERLNRVGSIFYQGESKSGQQAGYFFKSFATGKIEKVDNQSAVSDLIQSKMEAARRTDLSSITLNNAKGRTLGTIRSFNASSNDIVDIGMRNIQATGFDEVFRNVSSALPRATTSASPITPSNMGISDRFYGMDPESMDPGLRALADKDVAFNKVVIGQELTSKEFTRLNVGTPLVSSLTPGLTKSQAYVNAIQEAGLPYGSMEVRERLAGVARSRATANIGLRALTREGAQIITEGGLNLDPLVSTVNRLDKNGDRFMRQIADISPINYAIAQGAEDVFGLKYSRQFKDQNNQITRSVESEFTRDSYIRMTAGTGENVSSEKITMLAQDAKNLEIQIGEGRSVKMFSQEFYENTNVNSFIESHVQAGISDVTMPATTNYIFAPKNLGADSYENLANQVIGSQVRRFQAIKSQGFVASAMEKDFDAVAAKIFGADTNFEQASEKFNFEQLFAKGLSPSERIEQIKAQAGSEAADRYKQFLKSTGLEIQEDGIIFMSVKGEASELIQQSQRTTGIELNATINDQLSRGRTTRAIGMIDQTVADETRTIGFIMSPFQDQQVFEEASLAAQEAAGSSSSAKEVARLGRSEDLKSLQNATDAAVAASPDPVTFLSQAEDLAAQRASTVASPGRQSVEAGRRFMQANKSKIYLAGLAVAAAVIGNKMAKRKNENDVYDTTMQGMPVESGRKSYGIQDAPFSQKMASGRKDPLVTAGVVGNLDRSKINHTSMGADKNNHLFGG